VGEVPVPWDYPRPPDLRHTAEFGALTGRVSHVLGEHS
jgi:NitT/TauT family transport system ATP-binding protein